MPKHSQSIWRKISSRKGLFLIAGPCVIESETLCLKIGESLLRSCEKLEIPFIFKASFDKANRSSGRTFRGPGITAGLDILRRVRARLGVPILTDVHTEQQVWEASDHVDVLQIPAFLCRQTDLVQAAAETGCVVNVKKGQFLSPEEMRHVVGKVEEAGGSQLILTERGTTFGYNNLVVDMRSIPILRTMGYPVVFDATHSVQWPGGGGDPPPAPQPGRRA